MSAQGKARKRRSPGFRKYKHAAALKGQGKTDQGKGNIVIITIIRRYFSWLKMTMSTMISDDIAWLKQKHLIVWGAGHWGCIMLRLLDDIGIPVMCVLDKTAKQNEILIEGIAHELKTPDVLPELLSEKRSMDLYSNIKQVI